MRLTLILFALVLATSATAASAQEYKLGPIEIVRPWCRATPKGATTAAGYLTVKNTGSVPDRLLGGSLEAASADAEVHEMSMDGGLMRMRPLSDGLELPPGASVELKPGSYHLMFTGLTSPLVKGRPVKGALTFAKAGRIEIEFAVEGMGAPAPHEMDHMHNH